MNPPASVVASRRRHHWRHIRIFQSHEGLNMKTMIYTLAKLARVLRGNKMGYIYTY
ncbi:hypothetical protein M5C99_15125 [Acidovorax sp. NCPPB 2350]|nr:hypothetical protein M5C99_15125 [Acidovorax sp. NCPPB 2350]